MLSAIPLALRIGYRSQYLVHSSYHILKRLGPPRSALRTLSPPSPHAGAAQFHPPSALPSTTVSIDIISTHSSAALHSRRSLATRRTRRIIGLLSLPPSVAASSLFRLPARSPHSQVVNRRGFRVARAPEHNACTQNRTTRPFQRPSTPPAAPAVDSLHRQRTAAAH
ncbi:hypothetical protein BU26DRAFT_50854 [Trematosphaeria pertusa]|uniref:Uncharacterized protein n=1 Tax=Trematosphaeria pertusa TaxID=390896 RepID=A0A6A6I9A0_9PLEO|nr:uncharacterized protein BU26DRAFT_50854 [Trematosphaeria pertusa]KAF2246658.1 hypothetical protein BU26DRAFT_50854 [Trematosphaeria pertusa]